MKRIIAIMYVLIASIILFVPTAEASQNVIENNACSCACNATQCCCVCPNDIFVKCTRS